MDKTSNKVFFFFFVGVPRAAPSFGDLPIFPLFYTGIVPKARLSHQFLKGRESTGRTPWSCPISSLVQSHRSVTLGSTGERIERYGIPNGDARSPRAGVTTRHPGMPTNVRRRRSHAVEEEPTWRGRSAFDPSSIVRGDRYGSSGGTQGGRRGRGGARQRRRWGGVR